VCEEEKTQRNNSEATSVDSFQLFVKQQRALCLVSCLFYTADLDVVQQNGLGQPQRQVITDAKASELHTTEMKVHSCVTL
jgi:hypothetical protein